MPFMHIVKEGSVDIVRTVCVEITSNSTINSAMLIVAENEARQKVIDIYKSLYPFNKDIIVKTNSAYPTGFYASNGEFIEFTEEGRKVSKI